MFKQLKHIIVYIIFLNVLSVLFLDTKHEVLKIKMLHKLFVHYYR